MKILVMAFVMLSALASAAGEASEADVRRRNDSLREAAELEAKRNAIKECIRHDLEAAETLVTTAELMEGVRKTPPREVERLSEKFAYETDEPKTFVKTESDKRMCTHRWIKLDEGRHYRFRAEVRAEDVKGTVVKFGLMVPRPDGDTRWAVADIGAGTFDWRPVTFDYTMPVGSSSALFLYGLEAGSGTAGFRNVTVCEVTQ